MFLPLPDPGLLCDSGPRPPLSGPVSLLSSRLDSMSPRPFRPGHRVTSAAQGHQRLSPLSRGPGLLLGPRLAWPPCPQQEHPSHLRDRLSVPPPPALALFRLQNNVYHFTLHDTLPSSFLPSFPPATASRYQKIFLGYFHDFNFPFPISSLPPYYILGSFWASGMSLHFPSDTF